MATFNTGLSALFHLFYPHVCVGCGSDLLQPENALCLMCINELPVTHFSSHVDNATEKVFWGRADIRHGMSLFYFAKSSIIQNIIYELKYRGNKAIGEYLGIMMGESIAQGNRFKDLSAIVPLPLFAAKQKQRGYNQAEILCRGIGQVLQLPVLIDNVVRVVNTETQTRKRRLERWKNVDKTFRILTPLELENQHILLVDDVITTGSTLDACASEILKVHNAAVSVASLAIASD